MPSLETPEQRLRKSSGSSPSQLGGFGFDFGSWGGNSGGGSGGQQGNDLGMEGQIDRDFSEDARMRRLRDFLNNPATANDQGIPLDGFDAAMDLRNSGDAKNATQQAQQAANRSVTAMLAEAFRLQRVEDDRFGAASERLTRSVDQLPETFSDKDFEAFFRDEFTLGSDQATQAMFGDMGNVRAALGHAGITGGGVAAGLAQAADLRRLRDTKQRALTARLDLRQAKMNADAQDALRNLQAEFNLATFNNQSPSMLGLDALTNASELALTELGLWLGDDAARRKAKADKDAGLAAGIGGAIGAISRILPF